MMQSSEPVVHSTLGDPGPAGRLIDAFLDQMAESGVWTASARKVAARAGLSASSINYHFDSIERLYGLSQAQAVAHASAWLDSRLEAVEAASPWPIEAFAVFAADLIDGWSQARVLAQAEATACTQAVWTASEAAVAWLRLWEAFWTRALPCFSLEADMAPVVSVILQSERLGHLARWRAPYDRAGLQEVCVRLVARLSGDEALMAQPAAWRAAAEAMTRRMIAFPTLSPAAGRLAESVVAAVDEGGEAALTHRAVAAMAGVSLGAVTHHFPTRSTLAEAGYACLYDSLVRAARRAVEGQAEHDVGEHLLSVLDVGRTALRSRAFEVFFLAATRDPALSNFAARIRYSRGLSTWDLIRPGAPHLTRLDALLLSHWTSGACRTLSAQPERHVEMTSIVAASAARIFG